MRNKVYYITWGATMTLAAFFKIGHSESGKSIIAIQIPKSAFSGEFGTSEYSKPEPMYIESEEPTFHAARKNEDGEIWISFLGKKRLLQEYVRPVSINTYD